MFVIDVPWPLPSLLRMARAMEEGNLSARLIPIVLDASGKVFASKTIDGNREIWQMESVQEWKETDSTAMTSIVRYVHCTTDNTLPCRWHFLGN